jgi:flagellum-specific peptidoglycan hydrolase FlgJ
MVKWLFSAALLLVLTCSFAPDRHPAVTQAYIDRFQHLAVAEMTRSGIPASIKLAQALHESQSGTSPLAQKANNHFGIKCKVWWDGKTYYHKDDDLNRNGELIESCFRSYNSAVDSYLDHSDFLMYRSRYAPLFDIPNNDYVSWAKGLQQYGYATDPQYANKIIKIIEKHGLNRFDQRELYDLPEELSRTDLPDNYQPKKVVQEGR